MSGQFEQSLDLALETRQRRLHQQQAERVATEKSVTETHAILERMQVRFDGEVHSLLKKAVERANRHFARRPENCQLCEVSGYFTGPLFAGGSACNPIAFEMRWNGDSIGDTLIVELTGSGQVEAFLGPLRPGEPQANAVRLDFGWEPVSLKDFTTNIAQELVLRYVNAVTVHLPLESAGSRVAMMTRG